jgi:hypothetical protein
MGKLLELALGLELKLQPYGIKASRLRPNFDAHPFSLFLGERRDFPQGEALA